MTTLTTADVVLRIVAATAAGLLIGLERERLDKVAGLRTLALVACGSALFTLVAVVYAPADTVRMAAGVATGIGFLGAGVIIQDRGQVLGLTTAATVWTTAAIGICTAAGALLIAGIGTALTLFVLTVLGKIDMSRLQQDTRTYEVTYASSEFDSESASKCLVNAGLAPHLIKLSWSEGGTVASWRVIGTQESHARGMEALRQSKAVVSFTTTV